MGKHDERGREDNYRSDDSRRFCETVMASRDHAQSNLHRKNLSGLTICPAANDVSCVGYCSPSIRTTSGKRRPDASPTENSSRQPRSS